MIRRILVFSFTFIGDATLSTAVISPLRQRFPDAEIVFLVGPRAFELLSSDGQIDRVMLYDNHGNHAGLRGKLRLVQALRREKFDLVVDLRDSFWSRWVGAKRWGIRLRGKAIHAVTRYLDVLARHGLNPAGAEPRLQFTPQEIQQQKRFMIEHELEQTRPLIGIHPGGNWSYKLWQPANFARVADILHEKLNAQILLFAGPDEQKLLAHVASLTHVPTIVVSEKRLRAVAALIAACDLYIGNDTGPMHIAAAVGTPVVAIFGSTSYHRSGPYGKSHTVVQSGLNLGCNPCHPGRNPGGCKAGTCAVVEAVTIAQVLTAAEVLLRARGPHVELEKAILGEKT